MRTRFLCLVSLWLCALSAAAQVEVIATCPWQDHDGYTPIVITLRTDVPTVVALAGKIDAGEAQLTVAVPAGQTVRRTLLVPAAGRRWSSSVTLSWHAPGQAVEDQSLSGQRYRDFDVVVLDPAETFAVKELRDAATAKLGNPPEGDGGYRSSSAAAYPESRFTRWTADSLPDRWQGFPAWLTLVVTPAGERGLSESQRAAISAWTTAGGALMVTSAEQLAAWQARGAQVQVVSAHALNRRIAAVWSQAARTVDPVPVPGTNQVPVYGFVSIAILFALVVGPLNIWWCARRGRRHLLLVTTPLLSLGASLILLTYGVFADGFTLRRSAVQVLVLDQLSGRASAWTGMTLFAGLPPSTLAMDNDALLVPLKKADRRFSEVPMVELTWSDADQLASGGWIPARANQQLGVGMTGADKRRLAFTQVGEKWSVANGFDRPLATLTWIDPGNTPWHLEQSLDPGQSAALVPGLAKADAPPLRRLPAAGEQAVSALWPTGELMPGSTYVATFDGALVPIPGPAAIDAVPLRTWVVGRVGKASAPSSSSF